MCFQPLDSQLVARRRLLVPPSAMECGCAAFTERRLQQLRTGQNPPG